MSIETKYNFPDGEIKPKSEIQVQDLILKQKLEEIVLPKDMKIFGRHTADGLHVIGVESQESTDQPVIIAIPGAAHGNWSYIDLIKQLAVQGIELAAISPPGEEESRAMVKDYKNLTVQDYVEPLKIFIAQLNRSCVLMGHSFGGLVAQKIAEDPKLQELIKGLILLNSAPPSNLRHRNFSLAGEVFLVKDNLEWKKNLFTNEPEEDFNWWQQKLDQAKVSINVMNDYGVRETGGHIDPKQVNCPILELSGTEDKNAVTNLKQTDHGTTEKFPSKTGRITITDFYHQTGQHPQDQYKTVKIIGGPHDMMLGKYSTATAEAVIKNFKLFLPPESE